MSILRNYLPNNVYEVLNVPKNGCEIFKLYYVIIDEYLRFMIQFSKRDDLYVIIMGWVIQDRILKVKINEVKDVLEFLGFGRLEIFPCIRMSDGDLMTVFPKTFFKKVL